MANFTEEQRDDLLAKWERNRCPECRVDEAACVCSDPDFRQRRKGLESERDYMRRNMRIAVFRADEERGVLRREDRRIVEGLHAIGSNLERLVDAIHGLERASGVPGVIFDRLKEIEGSLSSMSDDISTIRGETSAIRVRLD